MFHNTKAFSGFAVDDIEAAQRFYGETLGLEVSEAHGILTLHIAGDRPTIVYPRPGHEPAKYTILNFPVDDIDAALARFREQGVELIDREPRTGIRASRVAFLHPRATGGVLTEIVEPAADVH